MKDENVLGQDEQEQNTGGRPFIFTSLVARRRPHILL